MSDTGLTFEADLSDLDADDWLAEIEEIAEEHGYFEHLGPDHAATFLDAGPQLLVTFEDATTVRKLRADGTPLGYDFARRDGWSVLTILSRDESWFRSGYLYRYFDRLTDDGFFEDFDRVLFHGVGPRGYAAAAYSVAAPGCRVLALRPQATLDPELTGWDNRFREQRRLDFGDRYGYAPDMIDAAERAWVIYNPSVPLDAMHAALFRRPNVTLLRAAGLTAKVEIGLDVLTLRHDLIRMAMAGDLDQQRLSYMLHARKNYAPYLRGLVKRARQAGHEKLAANACAHILRRGHDPFFATQLAELADSGVRPQHPISASAAE